MYLERQAAVPSYNALLTLPVQKREALNYLGGINKYRPEIDAALDMKNFELLGHDSKSDEDFVNKTGIAPDIAIVP